MSFSSHTFILLFLPVALSIYLLLLRHTRANVGFAFVIAVSVFFYWMLDGLNLLVILGLVAVNYCFAAWISRPASKSSAMRPRILLTAVILNVLLFLYLKDFSFTDYTSDLVIPIGISFVIVQQVMYLVSSYEHPDKPASPVEFGLFSVFFAYIIAGPVVRREEIFPQFRTIDLQACIVRFLPSLTLFSIGLFKKTIFADNLDPYVDQVFDTAFAGGAISTFDAWTGASLFTLQIYFDFSGYSDMAIGIAGFFGLSLPRNFHSPLKATSIMAFWRCWHRTMTRFFIDFVFMPLAVKFTRFVILRKIKQPAAMILRMVIPLLATFLVVGIWHGAGPNFVMFAVIMGLALATNQAWKMMKWHRLPGPAAWFLTILVVLFTLVLDRAPDFATARTIWLSMVGFGGTGTGFLLDPTSSLIWLAVGGAFVLLLPNSNEILAKTPLILRDSWDSDEPWTSRYYWATDVRGIAFTATVLLVGILSLTKAEDFIYYRF